MMCEIILLLLFVSIIHHVYATCDQSAAAQFAECALKEAMSGSWVKTSACALQLYKDCREEEHEDLPTEYDITINGNWTYLRELGNDGWTVKLAEYLHSKCHGIEEESQRITCLFNALNIDGCYVAWTGGFNKGTTTILNKVCDTNYATGYDADGETKGFNIILKEDEEVIHIDTPGVTRCVKPQDLQDRAMTDKFVYDVLPDLADAVVIVVDILTSDEQVLIKNVMEKIISFSTPQNQKKLYIVHNFQKLITKKDVEQHIESDIMKSFDYTERPKPVKKKVDGYEGKHVAYYTSKYKQKYQMTHFVFAAEHTEAGNYYNPIAKQWLSQRTNDMECNAKEINVLSHFLNKLEPLLRKYFYSDKITKENIVLPPPDPYAPLRRAARWIRGGWFYADEQIIKDIGIEIKTDPSNDPFKLIFKPVMGHDDYDGVIALQKSKQLVYCPAQKIGDTPQCAPKINCAVWKKPTEWGLQCRIADIEFGDKRDNFDEDINSKLFVLRPESGCELIIYGTILPPWRGHVDKENVETFELLYTDGMMHGFVKKRFVMDQLTCIRYKDNHQITYENGKLSVFVKLHD